MKSHKLLDEIEQKLAELDVIKNAAKELVDKVDNHYDNDNIVHIADCGKCVTAWDNLRDLVS